MAKKKKKTKPTRLKLKEIEKQKKETVKLRLLKKYVRLVESVRMFPTRADLSRVGISRDTLRHHFTNMKGIREEAKFIFPDYFEGVIDLNNYISRSFLADVKRRVKEHKRLIVTTAVSGQWCHPGFLASIETFCKKNNAMLVVLPSHDPAHNLDNEIEWHFDKKLITMDAPIIFDELALNSNIRISDMRVTAKQINPTTGLARLHDNSFIFASPKQSLEFVPNSNVKMPHAMMTTGSCTIKNYKTTQGNALRTSIIATKDHILGALIVEIVDNDIFHFTQIQADEKGGFAHFGKFYDGKKITKIVPKLKMGDYHAGDHDETAVKATEEMIDAFQVDEVFFDDVFNGASINHHEKDNIIIRARLSAQNKLSLTEELKITAQEIDRILSRKSIKKGIIVKANHDEFIDEYLKKGRFKDDPINFQIGCKLADKYVDGEDPLKAGIELVGGLKTKVKVVWLKRDQDYKIGGVECGAHGDKGVNGSRGNKQNLEKAYRRCVIGHSHTPGILRGVFQMGTLSKLQLNYNIGPSSWMHCNCLVYPNGQMQLINIINGKWRLK